MKFFWLITLLALSACAPKPMTNLTLSGANIIGGQPVGVRVGSLGAYIVGLHLISHPHNGGIVTTTTCTGTLIAPSIVLTAAHCLDENYAHGEVIFSANLNTAPQSAYRHITAKSIHPSWHGLPNPLAMEIGDIAVVRFEGRVPYPYSPVPIAKNQKFVDPAYHMLELGYGVFDPKEPEKIGVLKTGYTRVLSVSQHGLEVETNQREGVSACNGDSGGPAFVIEDNDWHMWGLMSRSQYVGPRNSAKDPIVCTQQAMFTNLFPYKAWILNQIDRLR